ncbi:MAG TPA: hypothetical protein V6C58_11860, partial [Allocoleopsis sp.]
MLETKNKFCLSPHYEFIETPTTEVEDAQIKLYDKKNDEVLLINPVIASFLKVFEKPATLKDALIYFQKETQSELKELKPIVQDFFDSMMARGILIRASDWVEIQNKPSMPNEEGMRLDTYHLQKRLSHNPPIAVYLAVDDFNTKYIIKKIYFPPQYPKKYQVRDKESFMHEFLLMKQLRGCENIVQLIEANKGKDYAVIEYFDGVSLRKRIEDIKPGLSFS